MKFSGYGIRFCNSVTSKLSCMLHLAIFIKNGEFMKFNTFKAVQNLSNQNLSNMYKHKDKN